VPTISSGGESLVSATTGDSADLHSELMSRALNVSRAGRYWASPNPHVGCVLVVDGRVISEGFTQPAGGNHAEVEALVAAGDQAKGATAYVTLEPCAHAGRTALVLRPLSLLGLLRSLLELRIPTLWLAGRVSARFARRVFQ